MDGTFVIFAAGEGAAASTGAGAEAAGVAEDVAGVAVEESKNDS